MDGGGADGVDLDIGVGLDTSFDGVVVCLLVVFIGFRVGFCCCRCCFCFIMLALFLYTWDCFFPLGSDNCPLIFVSVGADDS